MLWAQENSLPLVEFTLAPLWEEHGIPLALMGIFVVFVALALVLLFIRLLPRLLAWVTGPTSAPSLPSPPAPANEALPEEILVVIAAAVAVTLGAPHRIVSIRGLTPGEFGWSLEGRMQHHQSHRFRNRNH